MSDFASSGLRDGAAPISTEGRRPVSTMLRPIRSILNARSAAKDTRKRLLWIGERPAKLFHEPGWVEQQPHRHGAVLFLNRERR